MLGGEAAVMSRTEDRHGPSGQSSLVSWADPAVSDAVYAVCQPQNVLGSPRVHCFLRGPLIF